MRALGSPRCCAAASRSRSAAPVRRARGCWPGIRSCGSRSLLAADGPGSLAALPFDRGARGSAARPPCSLGSAWLLGSTALVARRAPGRRLRARAARWSPACARAAERACPGRRPRRGRRGARRHRRLRRRWVPRSRTRPRRTGRRTRRRVPDRAAAPGPRRRRRTGHPDARARTVPRPHEVVVRPGDSLWSIAEGLLGPAADDAEVTAAWHRLHRANRSRVGDPDLIRPGHRLVVPAAIASPAPDREEPPR